jgi:meso-butanediol dehydrogenase/(S,S)-butanediol dehydrogenase/diacetyl reductase
MAGRLQGKVAIITGGNSGIGEATAHCFAQEGAIVALLARREPEGQAVQHAIRGAGGDATFIPCDVTDHGSVEAAVAKTVTLYGGIQVLFNNAGGGARETFPAESDDVWDRVLRVNLTGTFLMSRAVWPHLVAAGGGAIINMSSQAAGMGMTEPLREIIKVMPSASYFVAKAGIEAFTRYIAGMGAPHNIRVNCVRPRQILTAKLTTDTGEHFYKPYHSMVQMLRGPGQPVDVANTVVFLASEEARFITAALINIDGGSVCKV